MTWPPCCNNGIGKQAYPIIISSRNLMRWTTTYLASRLLIKWFAYPYCKCKVEGLIATVSRNDALVQWMKHLTRDFQFREIHAHLQLVDMGQWGWSMVSLSYWLWDKVFTFVEECHIVPATSWGEPLATWLAVWMFSQVVSTAASQMQGHGFDPYFGYSSMPLSLYDTYSKY